MLKLLLLQPTLLRAASFTFGQDDPGQCDTVGSSFDTFHWGSNTPFYLVGGYTKSMTKILTHMGDSQNCFDRGVAMLVKVSNKGHELNEASLAWVRYFDGAVNMDSGGGSYTDIPVVKIPFRTENYPGKFPGLAIAMLQYTDKSGQPSQTKNLLIIFKQADGSLLRVLPMATYVPKMQHLFQIIGFYPTPGYMNEFDQYSQYIVPQQQELKVFGIHTHTSKNTYQKAASNFQGLSTKLGFQSVVERNYRIILGGSVYDASNDWSEPFVAKVGVSHYATFGSNYAFSSVNFFAFKIGGFKFDSINRHWSVDQLFRNQVSNQFVAIINPYDSQLRLNLQNVLTMVIIHRDKQSPQFLDRIDIQLQASNFKMKIWAYQQFQNNFVLMATKFDSSGYGYERFSQNTGFILRFNVEKFEFGSDGGMKFVQGGTQYPMSDFASKTFDLVQIGKLCANQGDPYCEISGAEFYNYHETRTASVDGSDYADYQLTYLVSTDRMYDDSSNTQDCWTGYTIPASPSPGIKYLNQFNAKIGKVLMLVTDKYNAAGCFSNQVNPVAATTTAHTQINIPVSGIVTTDIKDCLKEVAYTHKKTADYLTQNLPVQLWKITDGLSVASFKEQFEVSPCSTPECQLCPTVINYRVGVSKTAWASETKGTPETAFYDPSSSQYKVIYPSKLSNRYTMDLYLVAVLNFENYGQYSNYKIISEYGLTPQWYDHYYLPSCKPSCLTSNSFLIYNTVYKLESTGNCYHIKCKTTLESHLDKPFDNRACVVQVDCKGLPKCTSADVFKLKTGTPNFNWDYDASELPKEKAIFDVMELGPSQKPEVMVNKIQLYDGVSSYTTLQSPLADSVQIADSSKGTVKIQGTNEFENIKLRITIGNEYQCFDNDKRLHIPLEEYYDGSLTLDNCIGQQFSFPRGQDYQVKQQANRGKISLYTSKEQTFTPLHSGRCIIRKVEILTATGQAIQSANSLYGFLYLSTRTDLTKLVLDFNSDLPSGQNYAIHTFQIKATTRRTPSATQTVKIILGCFDQGDLKVELIPGKYAFIYPQDGALFKVVSALSDNRADQLTIDLKETLRWTTNINGCTFSRVSICPDQLCVGEGLPTAEMTPVITNEETGAIGPMILKITGLNVPSTYQFFIKSELPNRQNVISKVQVRICGQEIIKKKENKLLIKEEVKKQWLSFALNEFLELDDPECPIEKYELCSSNDCSGQKLDGQRFKVQSNQLMINLESKIDVTSIYLKAITKGKVSEFAKIVVWILEKPKEEEKGSTIPVRFQPDNFSPVFANGIGEIENIVVKKGKEVKSFTSNKASDLENNVIKIEIIQSLPKFVQIENKGDFIIMNLDTRMISSDDEGKETIFDLMLTDDVATIQTYYKMKITVEKSQGEEEITSEKSQGESQGQEEKDNEDKKANNETAGGQNKSFSVEKENLSEKEGEGEERARLDYIMNLLKEQNKKANNQGLKEEEAPEIFAAWIEYVDQLGLLEIKFNSTLNKEILPPLDKIDSSIIQVTIIPHIEEPDNLKQSQFEFAWRADSIDWENGILRLKLDFEEPHYISTGSLLDIVQIKFKKPWLFQAQQTQKVENSRRLQEQSMFLHQKYNYVKANIGRQLPADDTAFKFSQRTVTAAKVAEYFILIVILLRLFYKGALKSLMGALVLLQVIIYMSILNVQFPGNMVLFQTKIRPIISFDILNLGEINKNIFNFDYASQKEIRDKNLFPALQDMGIKYTNSIVNLGLLAQILIVFMMLGLLIVPILKVINHFLKNQTLKNIEENMDKKIFFGMLIGIVLNGFMPISIALYINYMCPITTTGGEIFSNVFSFITFVLAFVVVPICVMKVFMAPTEQLEEPLFKQRYGALYSDIKCETRTQRLQKIMFIGRRAALILIGLWVVDFKGMQAQLIIMINLLVMMYIGQAQPFKTRNANKMECFNEFFMIMISYNLLFFTDYLESKEFQYEMAWVNIFIIFALILTNTLYVMAPMLKLARLQVIKFWKIYQYNKDQQQKRTQIKNEELPIIEEESDESSSSSGKESSSSHIESCQETKRDLDPVQKALNAFIKSTRRMEKMKTKKAKNLSIIFEQEEP